MIAEPEVVKFDKKDDKIEVEIKVFTKPEVNIEDYKECVPEVEKIEVSEDEINEELQNIARADLRNHPSTYSSILYKFLYLVIFQFLYKFARFVLNSLGIR
jgi:hypothetical protein